MALCSVWALVLAGCGDNIVGAIPLELLRDAGPRDAGFIDDDGGTGPTYPVGPYGNSAGEIIDNAIFAGYLTGTPQGNLVDTGYLESVTMRDLRELEGYTHLLLNVAADWCAECKLEAREFPHQYETWAPRGGLLVSVVIEDTNTLPATKNVLDNWVGAQAPNYTTLHDPSGFINGTFAPATLPMNAIIDLSTMEIKRVQIGTDPAVFAFFESLLDQ